MKIKIPEIMQVLAPKWTKKILKRKTFVQLGRECTVDGEKLDIGEYECCIVGESLNFFDKSFMDFEQNHGYKNVEVLYHNNCKACTSYSHLFQSAIKHEQSKYDLEVFLEKFANHVKDKHPNYIVNAKRRNKK